MITTKASTVFKDSWLSIKQNRLNILKKELLLQELYVDFIH